MEIFEELPKTRNKNGKKISSSLTFYIDLGNKLTP